MIFRIHLLSTKDFVGEVMANMLGRRLQLQVVHGAVARAGGIPYPSLRARPRDAMRGGGRQVMRTCGDGASVLLGPGEHAPAPAPPPPRDDKGRRTVAAAADKPAMEWDPPGGPEDRRLFLRWPAPALTRRIFPT